MLNEQYKKELIKKRYLIFYNHSGPIKTSSHPSNILQDTYVAYFSPKLNVQLRKDVKFWPGMQTDMKHLPTLGKMRQAPLSLGN